MQKVRGYQGAEKCIKSKKGRQHYGLKEKNKAYR